MAADSYRFDESDSLLCYHGPMLYEAKCLKRRKMSDGRAQYFIHYKGWNSKWEEWVDDDRVLIVNSSNMNKMASLKEIHSNSKKSGTKRSITALKEETIRNTTPPVKGRKRKHSEISVESIKSVNVPSSAEPKPKKRGRPPKIVVTPKFEPIKAIETTCARKVTDIIGKTETMKVTEIVKVTEKFKATDISEGIDKIKISDASEMVKIINTAETTDAVEKIDTVKKTDTIEVTKKVDETDTVEGTKETEEEATTSVVFTVPAPVIKTIPVINIPLILKKRIAYDYTMTTYNKKVLKFPRKLTIEKLIRSYLCSIPPTRWKYRERAVNIALSLIQYFNILIHRHLLYPNEREQKLNQKAKAYLRSKILSGKIQSSEFTQSLYPKKFWHCVYGPTYLLRLFVNLPKLVSTYVYTDKQVAFIVKNFEYFLKFVENNYEKYFTDNDYDDYDDYI